MKIHQYNEMMRYLTRPKVDPSINRPSFKPGGLVEPSVVHHDSRVGYQRGSTIAMQKPVEFYVDVIKNMIKDSKYVPPVNINAREVGKIPNFLKAKELVKAETGESFDVLYNRNIQKRKKIKRAEDPIKKEKDIIAKAERKSKRRVLKADPSDPVKMTDREQALNFEQRKYNKDLNLKIRQNPDLILKDKMLMDKLSTTVSKDGNIIKVKPTLDDIKKRGIIEVDHQRDIFKKGKLKDLPYNRNFILGPYNRGSGFKKTAETFIEKNPDANNIKVKNILKKAEELGVTLQPDVPKGTFPTKSVGYKQVGGPVEKFANAAAHSFKGSTFEKEVKPLENKLKPLIKQSLASQIRTMDGETISAYESVYPECFKNQGGKNAIACLSKQAENDPKKFARNSANIAKATEGTKTSTQMINFLKKYGKLGRGIGWFAAGEAAFAPLIGLPMWAQGASKDEILHMITWGAAGTKPEDKLLGRMSDAGRAVYKAQNLEGEIMRAQEALENAPDTGYQKLQAQKRLNELKKEYEATISMLQNPDTGKFNQNLVDKGFEEVEEATTYFQNIKEQNVRDRAAWMTPKVSSVMEKVVDKPASAFTNLVLGPDWKKNLPQHPSSTKYPHSPATLGQHLSYDPNKPMFKSGGKVDYDNYLPDIDDDK